MSPMLRSQSIILMFLSLLISTSANCQAASPDSSTNIAPPIDVVVTANKMPESSREVTQKVDIVSAALIEQESTTKGNIADAFRYQPSTFVNVLSRNDANWGAYGGLGPKYDVYMLDGLPIDSFVDLMNLDPWALGGAEVQRGPAGTMYPNYLNMDFAGNESPLAGITNLLLKDDINGPLTKAELAYGSWDTRSVRAYHQDARGALKYFFGLSHEESDYTNYGTSDSWLHMLNSPDYHKTKLYGKATYEIDPGRQFVSLFYNHVEHTGDVGRPNRDFDNDYDLLNAVYFGKFGDLWQISGKVGDRAYSRQWQEDNFPDLSLRETDSVKQNIVPIDISATYSGFGLLTFGTDMQFASYKTAAITNGSKLDTNDVDARAGGVYAQEKAIVGDWVLRGGLRYSDTRHDYSIISGADPADESKSWNKVLWSAGLRYNPTEQLSLYGNAGSSYLVPSAKSVGGTLKPEDQGVAGMNGQLPNASLNPESGNGYDLGVDFAPFNKIHLGIRGFLNIVDDAIVENRVSEDPSQSRSVNAGRAVSDGFEAEAKYEFLPTQLMFANYTFTHTDVSNHVDPDQDGSKVPFVPNYTINTGATFLFPWNIEFSPYISLIGDYYDSSSKGSRKSFGGDTILNARLRKPILERTNYHAKLGLDLNNILDRKFEMPWQFQDPGFNAYVRLEIEFS